MGAADRCRGGDVGEPSFNRVLADLAEHGGKPQLLEVDGSGAKVQRQARPEGVKVQESALLVELQDGARPPAGQDGAGLPVQEPDQEPAKEALGDERVLEGLAEMDGGQVP